MVQHLVGPTAFPALTSSSRTLSIASYNVLLPNSQDGWWTYKMYNPPLTDENRYMAEWGYRRDLIRDQLAIVDADVVCLQEVSPLSFASDFEFMKELGYDCSEMFRKKSRFRPATFWKSSRLTLVTDTVHKDRTMITAFRFTGQDDNDDTAVPWFVLNCHLQAGPQGARRVRQIHEGVRGVVTLAKKLKVPDPLSVPLIVCGDFNSGDDCGATRYLEEGFIDETHREDNTPVTSGRKDMPLAKPLVDVLALERADGNIPPTMVVAELISKMVEGGDCAYENPYLSQDVLDKLERIFTRLASGKDGDASVMTKGDVEKYLVAINGQVGRGSEFREAARQMGYEESEDETARIELPSNGFLTLSKFQAIYDKELKQGKFWGIAYDLAILGEPIDIDEMFQSRFDRIYASDCLSVHSVMDFCSDKPCPNERCPSDHLPLAALFALNSVN